MLKTQIQFIMKTKKIIGLFVSTLILGLTSCENEKVDSQERDLLQEIEDNSEMSLGNAFYGRTSKSSSDCHFEYEGHLGPENWADICGEEWKDCDGNAQSPIDIRTRNVHENDNIEELETDYNYSMMNIYNNGHTIQFNYDSGSTALLDGKRYELLQFHFHTSSEHTIDGYRYPMEMHLVHRDVNSGLLAVIGIFFKEGGRNNHFLDKFMSKLPENEGDHYTSDNQYTIGSLIPEEIEDFYTYSGSLTTPACSEIVTWFVVKQPVYASHEQLERFEEIMHENFRPTQDLNGRVVYSSEE